ncbi:unnamed protein product [Closterium sp. NIES-65]|nr:unnamed protein product [Closterium sp. NIES-65]
MHDFVNPKVITWLCRGGASTGVLLPLHAPFQLFHPCSRAGMSVVIRDRSQLTSHHLVMPGWGVPHVAVVLLLLVPLFSLCQLHPEPHLQSLHPSPPLPPVNSSFTALPPVPLFTILLSPCFTSIPHHPLSPLSIFNHPTGSISSFTTPAPLPPFSTTLPPSTPLTATALPLLQPSSTVLHPSAPLITTSFLNTRGATEERFRQSFRICAHAAASGVLAAASGAALAASGALPVASGARPSASGVSSACIGDLSSQQSDAPSWPATPPAPFPPPIMLPSPCACTTALPTLATREWAGRECCITAASPTLPSPLGGSNGVAPSSIPTPSPTVPNPSSSCITTASPTLPFLQDSLSSSPLPSPTATLSSSSGITALSTLLSPTRLSALATFSLLLRLGPWTFLRPPPSFTTADLPLKLDLCTFHAALLFTPTALLLRLAQWPSQAAMPARKAMGQSCLFIPLLPSPSSLFVIPRLFIPLLPSPSSLFVIPRLFIPLPHGPSLFTHLLTIPFLSFPLLPSLSLPFPPLLPPFYRLSHRMTPPHHSPIRSLSLLSPLLLLNAYPAHTPHPLTRNTNHPPPSPPFPGVLCPHMERQGVSVLEGSETVGMVRARELVD